MISVRTEHRMKGNKKKLLHNIHHADRSQLDYIR